MITAVTKMVDEDFHIHFNDGTMLQWNPDRPQVLVEPVTNNTFMGGPRFEAWEEYRRHPRGREICCVRAQREHCVCSRYTRCVIHGSFHYGTHD